MRRHVLPNAMVATLTCLPVILTGSITTLTALDSRPKVMLDEAHSSSHKDCIECMKEDRLWPF